MFPSCRLTCHFPPSLQKGVRSSFGASLFPRSPSIFFTRPTREFNPRSSNRSHPGANHARFESKTSSQGTTIWCACRFRTPRRTHKSSDGPIQQRKVPLLLLHMFLSCRFNLFATIPLSESSSVIVRVMRGVSFATVAIAGS